MRMSQKPGRNDPCPCGSGKKFKKCHLNFRPLPPDLWAKADLHFANHMRKEHERKAQFGEVREPVTTEFLGKRVIAVGNQIYTGEWRLFMDFLDPFIRDVFGQEWGQTQLRLPEAERHTLMDWRLRAWKYMSTVAPNPDGIRSALPSGFVAAFFSFAYDLYVVADNNRLDDTLLARLKHPDQFQGARHELFAEATCLRAGFTVQHEDETDPTRRHVEFVATFKPTGHKVSVEAKSKHRPGVLGRAGLREREDRANLRFGSLIQDAVKKEAQYPLVVFMDTNLPLADADKFFKPQSMEPVRPSRGMLKVLDLARRNNSGTDPYSLIVFTNHPHHYTEEHEADPTRHLLGALAKHPAPSEAYLPALTAICRAAALYGNIPNEFPTREAASAAP
jgi:uncharacterized protein YchJ